MTKIITIHLLLADHSQKTPSHQSACFPLIETEGSLRSCTTEEENPVQLYSLTEHWWHILCQNESIIWHVDLHNTLQNLIMRQDFVSVMLFSCDLLSHSRSLTDETLSVMPLSERSYIHCLVSKWLMDSKGHDCWDIKLRTVQRI